MEEVIKSYRDGFNPNPISSSQNKKETSAFNTIVLMSFLAVTLLGIYYFKKKKIEQIDSKK